MEQITFRILKVNQQRQVNNIIIIGSTALDGPWPPQANVASDSILGSHQSISTTYFPCVFLYPVNPF